MDDSHPLSRRAFLRAFPVVTAGAASLPVRAATVRGPHWAMLIDTRSCIGCQACTVACTMENKVPEGSFRTLASVYVVEADESAGTHIVPRLCNHCEEPPCVRACPVGATFKREDGIVLVDGERCVGCAYCIQACPYEARFINHRTGKADKCTFCAHRIEAGLLPACVETCVGGARIFGDLNDPKSELRRRVDAARPQLKVLKPEQATKPNVFYIGLDGRLQGRVAGKTVALHATPSHGG